MENYKERAIAYGQEHLLNFEGLTAQERVHLIEQLESLDWSVCNVEREDLSGTGKLTPIFGLSIEEIRQREADFEAIGRAAVAQGKVAAVLLAGGQGTRLGSDTPKGMFDVGITRPVYIFERHIDYLKEVQRRCGAYVPLFIMTSEKNDFETRTFFKTHQYFGYPTEYLRFFRQEMTPCVGLDGKILLEARGRIATSPNGNGGWYASLKKSGIDGEFPAIEWYNVFSVDNVLQRSADPVFVGATIASGANCGAKVVKKVSPEERVGVLGLENGKPTVIEYYELSAEMANLRDENGELAFRYGVILNYLFRAKTLEKIADEHIPLHVVKKKIPYLNGQGETVLPQEENGYKFETLILDMVKLAGSCLPFEVRREVEFAPVKNRTGIDSVESARELLIKNGVKL